MKKRILLFGSVAALALGAQCAMAQTGMESEFGTRLGNVGLLPWGRTNATEIVKGNVGLSGIAVDLATFDNPLQLINPLAPPKYGTAEDNTLRDVNTGRAIGWKLFSIRF
jgi:hypothetical protein